MAAKSSRRSAAAGPDVSAAGLGLERTRASTDDGGLSLEELGSALSAKLDAGDDPYAAPAVDALEASADLAGIVGATPAPGAADDGCEISPRTILEAMLFVGSPGNEPLSSRHVASLMRGVRPAEIDLLVRELNADYLRRRCPYEIVAEGTGYRMQLRDAWSPMRDRFLGRQRHARLSQAAIEVLAAVAYNEPITSDEVARLRGVPSGPILLQLVRRQLLHVERSSKPPRRLCYQTTPRFLELFSLKSLEELPKSYDLEETS